MTTSTPTSDSAPPTVTSVAFVTAGPGTETATGIATASATATGTGTAGNQATLVNSAVGRRDEVDGKAFFGLIVLVSTMFFLLD